MPGRTPGKTIVSSRRGTGARRLLAAAATVLALPTAVQAQSINHAELEQLFGEPVTTSVTGKPQRASEAAAALVIITRDDIRRSPAIDIPGLLQAYAGIDVVRWTSGHADVVVRGGVRPFDPRLLVLVNGRQVYLDHYGMTNWAGIGVQLEEIQQIEIVRGPNSALFGFNAVSGVINIITVNPLHREQVTGTIEAGTEGYLRLSQSLALKLTEDLGLRVSAGYQHSDEYDGLATSALAGPSGSTVDPNRKEAAGELYFKLDPQTEGTLSATYSDSVRNEVPELPIAIPAFYEFTAFSGALARDTGWGTISAHAFRNRSDIAIAIGGPTGSTTFHNIVFVTSADALVRVGTSDTLRLGGEYRANQLRLSLSDTGITRYKVYAGSGMWEHRLGELATFTLAGRLDLLDVEQQRDASATATAVDYRRSYAEWSLNSGLLVKLGSSDTLRLAAGRGVQAPSLYSFGARLAPTSLGGPEAGAGPGAATGAEPSIDDVRPSIIWSGEIGLIHALPALAGEVELTAFYNNTDDVIRGSANVGSFEAYGLTASFIGRLSTLWSWNLNYTWTKANDAIIGNSDGQFREPLALGSTTPEHKAKAQVSYERGPWLATVAARYTSAISQFVIDRVARTGTLRLVDIDQTAAFDAKLAFRINDHLTASVAGENLTDAGGAYLSPAAAERRLYAGLQVRF